MRILTTLSYWRPHISGLTVCGQRLIEGLSKKGFEFTVLTSRHDRKSPILETAGNIKILRQPVLFTLGKVPAMPGYLPALIGELRKTDLVWIHLPQAEGLMAILAAKLFKKKVAATVHCLPLLPSGWQRFLFQKPFDRINNLIILLSDRVVYYTKDYAENTKELWHFPEKSSYILPPIPEIGSKEYGVSKSKKNREIVVGFAGRIAEDKGLEYLIKAIQLMKQKGQGARLLMAGADRPVGESRYADKINSLIEESGIEVAYLGEIKPDEMKQFYQRIDILVLPSVNRTEAFGIVQAEAMKFGVPVIASNLPGVRIPVSMVSGGKIVPATDFAGLAKAIVEISSTTQINRKLLMEHAEKCFPQAVALFDYERVFLHIKN